MAEEKSRSMLFGYCYTRYHDRPETNPWDLERLEESVLRGYITQSELLDIVNGVR